MKKVALLGLLIVVVASLGACGTPAATPAPTEEPLSPTIAKVRERGKLVAGTVVCLPWTGKDLETDEYFGPTIDVARWMAEALDVELEVHEAQWGTIIPGLQAGKYDVAAAGLDTSTERLAVADHVPIFKSGFCYVALEDNDKVNTLNDLNDPEVEVALIEGSGCGMMMMEKYPDATYDTAPAPSGALIRLEEILSGRADVSMVDAVMGRYWVESYPELKVIPEDCVLNPDLAGYSGFFVNKGDPVWAGFITAIVNQHRDEIDATFEEYCSVEYIKSWFE